MCDANIPICPEIREFNDRITVDVRFDGSMCLHIVCWTLDPQSPDQISIQGNDMDATLMVAQSQRETLRGFFAACAEVLGELGEYEPPAPPVRQSYVGRCAICDRSVMSSDEFQEVTTAGEVQRAAHTACIRGARVLDQNGAL